MNGSGGAVHLRPERELASGHWLLASASSEDGPPSRLRMGSLVTVETGTGVLPAYVETLPRGPDSVRAARRLVGLALTVWGMDPGLRDSAQLVTSELVTNAVRHTRRAVRVTVTRLDGDRVKVAVVDLALTHPAPRSAGADQESGRGLQIVAALAKRQWGVDTLAFGKRVWAVVSGPGVEPGE